MELTINDVQNLLRILGRAQLNGMEEAEVAVLLKQKLTAMGQEMIKAQQNASSVAEVEEAVAEDGDVSDSS